MFSVFMDPRLATCNSTETFVAIPKKDMKYRFLKYIITDHIIGHIWYDLFLPLPIRYIPCKKWRQFCAIRKKTYPYHSLVSIFYRNFLASCLIVLMQLHYLFSFCKKWKYCRIISFVISLIDCGNLFSNLLDLNGIYTFLLI